MLRFTLIPQFILERREFEIQRYKNTGIQRPRVLKSNALRYLERRAKFLKIPYKNAGTRKPGEKVSEVKY